jgi:hypothetical protein
VLGTLNDSHIHHAAATGNAQHYDKTKTQGGELQWKTMKFGVHVRVRLDIIGGQTLTR